MSKEFRPIFDVRKSELKPLIEAPANQGQDHRTQPQESLEELKAYIRDLEERLKALSQERDRLERDLKEKEREIYQLKEKTALLGKKEALLTEIYAKIQEGIENTRESITKDFVEIGKKVIKEFVMTDLLPKEEVVVKILKQVFEKSLDLRGTVKILLNPSDVERVYDLIGELRERLSDKVDIEIESDEGLREGEVRIETPKFLIERKHEEILEEIFREVVKDVLEGG